MKRDTLLGELSAEMLGTFTLIIFGVGVVAQTVLTPFTAGAQSIHWAWGIGVTMGVYVAGGISGAHINPAVTLAFAVRRGFPWAKVLPYWGAQVVGAFLAALVVRWNFWEAFNKFDPAKGAKSQLVFSTLPGNLGPVEISQLGAFRDQIIGTAILVMVIFAIVDLRNLAPASNLGPLIIGLLVVGIGMAIGAAAGYAINPARDFGPRLASWITGWSNAWNDQRGDFYAWVPILGPFIGGVLGGVIYDVFISRFLPVAEPEVGRVPEAQEAARTTDTT
jgi:glycerol uptake facilitator protein